MAESTAINLVQPAATTAACDGAAAIPAAPLGPSGADGTDERPSSSTCTTHDDDDDDDDKTSSSAAPTPLQSVIAPEAAAQSVVVALHRIAATTIPAAAAVPVAAGGSSAPAGVRARATSVATAAVPRHGSIRRSSTATVVLNVARTLRQQVLTNTRYMIAFFFTSYPQKVSQKISFFLL